jgi:hypothetical protein
MPGHKKGKMAPKKVPAKKKKKKAKKTMTLGGGNY